MAGNIIQRAGLFCKTLLFPCQHSLVPFILNDGGLSPEEILGPKTHSGKIDAAGLRFAIVVARWNDSLTSRLLEGAIEALRSSGVGEDSVEVFKVPGAFELPLTSLKAAESGRFDAVIALGAVVRGETPHFDYVAGEAARGVAQVSLQTGIPVLFGVITADTLNQAENRAGGKAGNKGYEAAMSAIEVAALYREMESREARRKAGGSSLI